jgi:LacI family transcriptional regulator
MAKKMGYRSNTFASNLRRQRTNTIGVIVPRLNSSFMSDVLAGMEKTANNAGYHLVIMQSLENEKKEIINANTLFHNRVDGLLVSLSYDTKSFEHFVPFIDKGIPLIFFDRVIKHNKCSYIAIDNFSASYDVTHHLIMQGCKNLIHITGNLARNVYADRLDGFKHALKKNNLLFNEENLIVNQLTPQDGTKAAKEIIRRKNFPDGAIITNDLCAASFIKELKLNGIQIPQNIAVAGFNNDPISEIIDPPLTTINYKGFEMGEVAIRTMINQLHSDNHVIVNQSIIIDYNLIIRESSKRI